MHNLGHQQVRSPRGRTFSAPATMQQKLHTAHAHYSVSSCQLTNCLLLLKVGWGYLQKPPPLRLSRLLLLIVPPLLGCPETIPLVWWPDTLRRILFTRFMFPKRLFVPNQRHWFFLSCFWDVVFVFQSSSALALRNVLDPSSGRQQTSAVEKCLQSCLHSFVLVVAHP